MDTTPNDRICDLRERLKAKLKISELLPYKSTDPTKLQLSCNNVKLTDTLALADVGLKSGEMITCSLIEKAKIFLRINVKFLKRVHKMQDMLDFDHLTVQELRTILQNKLGLPVSCFRLLDENQVPLFDCHTLGYYGIIAGSTIHLDTWDDWTHFLVSAFNGDINETLENITNWQKDIRMNRYQMRVACFIAAHMDLSQLAAQLIKRGVRVDEPIGEHPSREWCSMYAHPDTMKTPVHQAAQMGSFSVLRVFLRKQPTCIIVRDGDGLTPCNLARRFKKIECFKLLIGQTFSTKRICGFTLSTLAKVLAWSNRAKDRVAFYKFEGMNKESNIMVSNDGANKTSVGNQMFIDGYGTNEIWDKCLKRIRDDVELSQTTDKVKKKQSFALIAQDAMIDLLKLQQQHEKSVRLPAIVEDSNTPGIVRRNKKEGKKKKTTFAPIAEKSNTPNVLQLTKENINEHERNQESEGDKSEKRLRTRISMDLDSRVSHATLPTVKHGEEIQRTNSMQKERQDRLKKDRREIKLPEMRKVSEIDALVMSTTGMTVRELAQRSLKLSQKYHEKNWSRSLDMALVFSKRALDKSESINTARSLKEKNTI